MFPSLAHLRAGGAASEEAMSMARSMNSLPDGNIKNLHDVQQYLEKQHQLNGTWDPRISAADPKDTPARMASWVLLVSEFSADVNAQQCRGAFQSYHAHCIWFLFAQHHKKKALVVRSNKVGRLMFNSAKFRDESAGAENNIATAVIGMLNDMKKHKLSAIMLPTGTYELNQLIEEGIRAAGAAVQLRSEKYAENPRHPAYPAALRNFASILRLAAEYENDPQSYMTEASNIQELASNVSESAVPATLCKVDRCLGVAPVVDSAALERGNCVLCMTGGATILGTSCRHLTLCEPCFAELQARHASDRFGCLVCRQVSKHGKVFVPLPGDAI